MNEMEDYYAKMFGAKPVKGEAGVLSMPGASCCLQKSDAPTATTVGRMLDHSPYERSSMGMSRWSTGFGAIVEITKAQGGYFDAKLLDSAFYQVDEGGRKQGDPRPQR